jgi:hypothetical protein
VGVVMHTLSPGRRDFLDDSIDWFGLPANSLVKMAGYSGITLANFPLPLGSRGSLLISIRPATGLKR